MELIQSKSILAKLMATENLIVEQRKVSTASFDVKNRVLTLPILDKNLSSNLYDLFTGHEVGHALYTPLDGMIKVSKDKINSNVVNVVEDSRIERKIKHKYPGLKFPFFKAYGELIERNFFETEGKDLDKYNLIDRINLHCKVGAVLAIKFTDEERQLLDAVESTETYEEVIEVSKRIIAYMQENLDEEELLKVATEKVMVSFDGTGEGEESDSEESDDPLQSDEQTTNDGSSGEEDKSEEDKKESLANKPDVQKAIEDEFKKLLEEQLKSQTYEAQNRNESTLYDSSGEEYLYLNIPKVDINSILDYKTLYQWYKDDNYESDTKSYLKYRKESEKVVSYLVKEFELRKNADQSKRAKISKTGELNMSKIYSYKFSEDIFKKSMIVPGGKSHGLILFLDWSGSMCEHISNTVKQLVNLTLFCKKVNIPFEVYSFIEEPGDKKKYFLQMPKMGDLQINKFVLANILSSRMNSRELTYAYGAIFKMSGLGGKRASQPYWLRMSGTPLNETIIAAMEIVPEFQKKHKLQFVNTVFLTDGEGHRLSYYYDMDYNKNLMPIRFSSDHKISKVILRDTVTKNEEVMDNSHSSLPQTKALIKLLKKRTNSNVIGFYIAHARELNRRMKDFYPDITYSKEDEVKNEFRKNKYLIVQNSGFDEYYILRSSGLNTEEDDELVVSQNTTTRGYVSAFSKYAGNKVNNRVILNRFINLIT